ncbi:PEP-CTERM sorting domain-containing protein [Sphingomonas sp. MA1305]|uniref:PEPxxWA-CTERM sorting domain-containing protein n=1 Tax=Sphingomonas sp. MA1305 TaxID=2479204 RepID=UPI0018DF26E8|nr:PEPxxWA-CTERM sorting domain-containing protein [Sphingomonas sp. MA1305]MBI0474427.1 PEP-CTERM sorting domain-containing protein [Sphingomonas sp. MA1305]
MKHLFTLAAAGAALAIAAPASATTSINFETTPSGASTTAGSAVGSTYSSLGINFTGASFVQCGGGCPAPAYGMFIAGANFTSPITATLTTLADAFSFANVSSSSGTANAYGATGNLLQSINFSDFPSTYSFAVTGIKSVTFSGPQYGVDNFSFNATAAVPEPATWALMILGMSAVGFAMRRRKNVNMTVRFA